MKIKYSLLWIATLATASVGCGKDEEAATKVNLTLKASGLSAYKASSLAMELSANGTNPRIKSIATPDTANGEYDGMGVLSSVAIVEGFKIHLTQVTLGTGTPGVSGGTESSLTFDKELDISEGINEPISVTGEIAKETYKYAAVKFKPMYKLKAYAYFDVNNDGTVDTTVFTTASEVKKTSSRMTKAQMEAAGYGEYKYGFAYTHCSESKTESTGECGTFSVFPEPLNLTDATESTVNLLIDSTRIVTAWTGDVGNYTFTASATSSSVIGDTTKIPYGVGFPLSSTCSDTPNSAGLNSCDFFPVGSPHFKLAYLPAFAFVDVSGLTSQVYLVSKESGVFNHYNTSTIQLVLKSGVPQLGLIQTPLLGSWDTTTTPGKYLGGPVPVLGSVARLFEDTGSSTYKFYIDGHYKDSSGNHDGGLYYNNDKTMAGHIVSGFKPLSNVGDTGTITVEDGPRCSGEYDYCLGSRTYYVKRFK